MKKKPEKRVRLSMKLLGKVYNDYVQEGIKNKKVDIGSQAEVITLFLRRVEQELRSPKEI